MRLTNNTDMKNFLLSLLMFFFTGLNVWAIFLQEGFSLINAFNLAVALMATSQGNCLMKKAMNQ